MDGVEWKGWISLTWFNLLSGELCVHRNLTVMLRIKQTEIYIVESNTEACYDPKETTVSEGDRCW